VFGVNYVFGVVADDNFVIDESYTC